MEVADLSLLPIDFNKRSPDNLILTVALKFNTENPILLTSDNGLQVKAKGLKITTITLKEFLRR
jgi:rRNA-processing protein FCF1